MEGQGQGQGRISLSREVNVAKVLGTTSSKDISNVKWHLLSVFLAKIVPVVSKIDNTPTNIPPNRLGNQRR